MSFARNSRLALAVPIAFLLLTLAAAPAHAAGSSPGLAGWWSWLAAWAGFGSATGQADEGPAIDPDGGNRTLTATGQADSGPVIDPLGGNRTLTATGQADVGPVIDPLGGNRG